MAVGWAGDNAVHEQVRDSVEDEIRRARRALPKGKSAEFCDECGEVIPPARQAALPGVRLCRECQEELDNSQIREGIYNRKGSKDSQLK